ncbi:MAG TPA: S8 family serine peptidase [Xanthomonadales bacterium]|nr:S8 family serine peptidase [Xanthomonadales bacterium]
MGMKKLVKGFAAFMGMSCLVASVWAQSPAAQATRSTKLLNLSQQLKQRDASNRQQALERARQMGIPARRQLPGGGVLELQRIVPGIGPVFYITNNLDAADTVSTDEVWPGGSAGLGLDGSGMTMAMWDGGAIVPGHPDFAGRLEQVDGASEVSGHSTHVAGTLAGSGANFYQAVGMAYAADLNAYDWNSDTAEMAAAAASGQLVSNHSYGIAAGWVYTGELPPERWWWIGGQANTGEDPNFGYYDTETQLWDQIAFDAPYYLIVKAGGNDRTDIGPELGEQYKVIDQDGELIEYSTLARDPDCWPAGYDCLPGNSVAKNILTVGAVDDLYGGYRPAAGPVSVTMADFSSWGPTDDGRIKPDLVGNGLFLFSTWPSSPFYAVAAGTSMAAPNISGSLLLLQQHYENLHGADNFMRAATLKALAIHTADEAGDADGPDYEHGWGLLNTLRAADAITADNTGIDQQIIEDELVNAATDPWPFLVLEAGSVLTATLVWSDPPGTPPAPGVDPPGLMLVNDLDLRIVQGLTTWEPWVLDPANPSAAATTGDNFRDNVEQVEIQLAAAGIYSVQVSHKGVLLDGLPQSYSLIIGVEQPAPTSAGFVLDESFDGGTLPPGWSVHTEQGVSWQIATPGPGVSNDTGSSGPFAVVENNFTASRTSLRTPVLDLTGYDAAVLRFNSIVPYLDEAETQSVDVSLDGGATWTFDAWTTPYFNPFAIQWVKDLSSLIIGEASVMLAFRWDSLGQPIGDTWQIDDVQLEVFAPAVSGAPEKAETPSPPIGATDAGISTELAWAPAAAASSYDVYFGLAAPLGPADFKGNQAGTQFNPGPLTHGQTYYWRIDTVNAQGTTSGQTWSFTVEAELVEEHVFGSGFEGG